MTTIKKLTDIDNSGNPYIIYKSNKGFDLYTNFSKKIILNKRNIHRFLNKKKINIKKDSFRKSELLKPTKIYVKEVLKLIDKNLINGCANITGGGLADNIKRVIPDNLVAEINLNEVKALKILKWLNKND